MERLQVTDDFKIFYEVVDGALFRRIEPIEIAWTRRGSGRQTALCLHSLTAASGAFEPLAEALAGEVELLTPDLRGFGESHRPTLDYTLATWVEDTLRLLAAAGIERPYLVGHGLGAPVALALARRVEAAGILVSGVALAPGEPSALTELIGPAEEGEDVSSQLEALTGAPAAAADLTPAIVARAAAAWRDADARDLASEFRAPLVVLAAEDDRLTPAGAEGGAAWLAERSGGELERVPGGHDAPLAHAAEALRRLAQPVEVK